MKKVSLLPLSIKKIHLFSFLLFWFTVVGCEEAKPRKQFEWNEEVKELTGGRLDVWLQKAPFQEELDTYKDGVYYMTNAEQVFPFMARFYNSLEEITEGYSNEDDPIFSKEVVLYQDPKWGDLFVSAVLLYETEEVFLDDSYMELGNPIVEGSATASHYRANLYETSVFENHFPDYKTGIYRVSANYRNYLLGFYQTHNLVFEVAIPYTGHGLASTLAKLNEVNDALGLHIQSWQDATVESLEKTNTEESFWKDPFVGIYKDGEYGIHTVFLKLADTPFERVDKPEKGDYAFVYESEYGPVQFYTFMKGTSKEEGEFNKSQKDFEQYENDRQEIFYKEEQNGDRMDGIAKAYATENHFLEIHYQYPAKDTVAKGNIHSMMTHLKTYDY